MNFVLRRVVLLMISVFVLSNGLKDLGYQNYNCPGLMGPSSSIPTSAHSVRPADIKVIGALGDSLTAGNGAGAATAADVGKQYRGLAFPIGGDNILETHITLPNVLLKYNTQLFGQSRGIGGQNVWSVAQLNVAVPGAVASGLPAQATSLVHQMQTHPEVNIQNDWKLVHIYIGSNDLCRSCIDNSFTPELYQGHLKRAIQILYDNLPRTIVMITGQSRMDILREIDEADATCKAIHASACRCAADLSYDIGAASVAYQRQQMDLQTSGIYDTRDDFTVIVQPFLNNNTKPAYTPQGNVDLEFFAPDCFHFSQYGHAVVAKALWNNIVQPIGSKTTVDSSDPTTALLCPYPACPFIRTTKNSANCASYFTL